MACNERQGLFTGLKVLNVGELGRVVFTPQSHAGMSTVGLLLNVLNLHFTFYVIIPSAACSLFMQKIFMVYDVTHTTINIKNSHVVMWSWGTNILLSFYSSETDL